MLELEVNGQPVQVVIPGLCHLIATVDSYDAQVVANGSPALCVALVRVAPRHPWLKTILDTLAMGGDYGELSRAALAIAVPLLVHHGVIPIPSIGKTASTVSSDGAPSDTDG
jgi:hypothetical protein